MILVEKSLKAMEDPALPQPGEDTLLDTRSSGHPVLEKRRFPPAPGEAPREPYATGCPTWDPSPCRVSVKAGKTESNV